MHTTLQPHFEKCFIILALLFLTTTLRCCVVLADYFFFYIPIHFIDISKMYVYTKIHSAMAYKYFHMKFDNNVYIFHASCFCIVFLRRILKVPTATPYLIYIYKISILYSIHTAT